MLCCVLVRLNHILELNQLLEYVLFFHKNSVLFLLLYYRALFHLWEYKRSLYNWDNQFRMTQLEFPNVKFYKVGTDLTYDEFKSNIR